MSSEVPTRRLRSVARRSAALLAAVAIVGCDSRTLEPTAAPVVSTDIAASLSSSATGTSVPGTINVPLADPSFEAGYYAGWSFPGGEGQYVDIGNLWQASNGTGSVDLNGFDPGWVQQSFATFPGVKYTVQFDIAGNPGSPQGVKTGFVTAAGATQNFSFNTQGRNGVNNMGWTTQIFSFQANAAVTTLRFQSTYTGNGTHPDKAQGPALDNVRVTWLQTPTTVTVDFGPGPYTYTGSAFSPTVTVTPAAAGPAVITTSGDCVNAGGICKVTAKVPSHDQYAGSSATADITIAAAPTTTTVAFGPGPYVYNGSAFTATATVSPAAAGTATVSYSNCTNAGTCTATASFAGSANYAPSTSDPVSITIDRAPTTTTTASFGAPSVTYNGSAFTATASVSPAAAGSASISYSGDCTNAGNTCSATSSFGGSANYLPSDGGSSSLLINKAPTSTSVSFPAGTTAYYTGSAFTATSSVTPGAAGSATITYSGQCVTMGTCTATATYAGNSNYLGSSATANLTIKYRVVVTGDQCKNGGWQYLTDDLGNLFKNQGDCVSFVATKGKNKGAGGA